MPTVRLPAVAGMFYPGSSSSLDKEVDELFRNVKPRSIKGKIRGLISPHAGYMYSGPTAAEAYGLLQGKSYDAVVVVGPSHREYFYGISIAPADAFQTPLGDVMVHKEIRAELNDDSKGIVVSESGHRGEHSVEVQLPFLQKILGTFSFVPIVMGDQKRELCEVLAEKLSDVALHWNVLLVASSDLSHYYPYDTAVQLDKRVIRCVEQFDADGLMELFEKDEAEACGGGPMVAVMLAAKKTGATRSNVLWYCNSGDVTGEKERVVGYLSAALLQVNG